MHRSLLIAFLLVVPTIALGQAQRDFVRFSLFAQTSDRSWDDGTNFRLNELISTIALRSGSAEKGGFEVVLDARVAGSDAENRDTRISLYNAYVGAGTAGGRMQLRLGQMWLNDLGGLGSVAGLSAEYRGRTWENGLRWRAGLFGGLEPKLYDAGYADKVKKGGGYVAIDGSLGRRHVLGWVQVKNDTLTERSVLTMLNLIPVGHTFFFYQSAEYDLEKAGGVGKDGLNYLFATARWAPVRAFEIQATYHHGRSVDARTITNDELHGRPVDQRVADGYLFESSNLRLTVRPFRTVRVWVGGGTSRNNTDDKSHSRLLAGLSTSDLLGSGIDVTASLNRIDRTGGAYSSWYASLGRSFGRRVYISADYTSSLSVIRLTGSDGLTVETRPKSKRYSLTSNVNLNRTFSLLLSAERLDDDRSRENRFTAGLTVRY